MISGDLGWPGCSHGRPGSAQGRLRFHCRQRALRHDGSERPAPLPTRDRAPRSTRPGNACSILLVHCLPMPKSRGRKPKKKRTPASAPKRQLDNFNTTPQEPALSTQPPQEPPLATGPHQEQPTPKIKQIAKLTTAVVLAAIAIVLCAYAFILTKLYIDETMRGDSVVRVKRHNSRSMVIRWSPAR